MEALKSSHFPHLQKLPREVSIMSATNHYATDLSDEQWAILEPLLPEQKWHPGGPGRPPCDVRQVIKVFSMSIRPAVSGGCCPPILTPGIRFMAIFGGGVARGWGRGGWSTF